MTTVRIAHTEPWPGRRVGGRGFGFFSMLVVLADDCGGRALPVWLNGPEGHGLFRGRDDDHAYPGSAEEITADLLRAAGVRVTGVDIDELDPALTTGPRRGREIAQATARIEDRFALVIPGNPWLATEPVPGDSPSARWQVPVTVRRDADGLDFSGPFVRGDRTDRHLGLAWGDVPGDGTLRLFRGAKLRLVDIDSRLVEEALRPQHRLVARIRLTDPRGNPVCARVHPPALTWSAEPAHP